jgi:ABC-type uncharacterized transport system fused permease/ATPase subunit
MQEKREADFRYGLVRVRENAESIAFYGGETSEIQLLLQRFKQSFDNCSVWLPSLVVVLFWYYFIFNSATLVVKFALKRFWHSLVAQFNDL